MTLVTCAWLGLVLLLASGCGEHDQANNHSGDGLHGKLVLTGSSTVAPLAGELAKRFETLHPDVRIDVQTGGSSRGIADARRGSADIGMASRALKPGEEDLTAHTIALDGISIIVHKDNPVDSLTEHQVVAIYTDKLNNWSQVGGPDAPITVVNKAEGRSTLELFLGYYKLKAEDIHADIVIGDNQQGILTVSGDPNAIGYVSIGTAAYEASNGTPIRMLPMAGVEPSLRTVRDGTFPLSRPLNLVTHGEVTELAMAFITFAQSASVNDLVEAQYFVPIADEQDLTR
ncbi:MAG: phosphate ABC transporter substrate-binding protein [Phycisphaeraceae bacterium]